MAALRILSHPIIVVVASLVFLSTTAFAGGKPRPDAGPIVSGWNIDLIDILETGQAYSATSSDPYVYAAYGSVLVVLDVTAPGNATRVGVALLPNVCQHMEVMGSTLYCYCAQSGVQIVDVSAPSAPALVGFFSASGNRLDADGNRLYVENWDGSYRLQVYDISNPTAPSLLGTSAFAIGNEFEAHNGYVYSAHNDFGLRIIDATNPANPVMAGSLSTGNAANNVDVAWPYAYVISDWGNPRGLYIVDVSNPAAPSQVGFYPNGPYPDFYEDVAVNGNRAYLAGGYAPFIPTSTLDVFDVSNPAAPVKLPSVFLCPETFDSNIDLSGRLAVLRSNRSICVMDCSNATVPVTHAHYESLPPFAGLDVTPTHLVMPTSGGGLAMIDQNDTQQRAFYVGDLDSEWSSHKVAAKDDYAYTLNCWFGGSGTIRSFDISDPASPAFAGVESWLGCPESIDLGLNHAYVSQWQQVKCIDISNPTAPDLVGEFSTSIVQDFAVAEPYLYVVTSDNGLVVVNVSNPVAPVPVGAGLSEAALGGQPLKIAVFETHAFILVAGATGGVRIVDIANPLLPTIDGNFEFPTSSGGGITAHNSFIYFSTDNMLHVLDVSNPSDPIEAGNISGVQLSQPPVLAAPFIYAYGGHILKFDTDLVTDVETPASTSLVLGQNYPNPFNPSTRIAFELPSASQTVIEIFDVQGSRVRTLVDETMTAGPHAVEWNGRDDGGAVVGSGVYFYRLTAGGHSQAKKMVILK